MLLGVRWRAVHPRLEDYDQPQKSLPAFCLSRNTEHASVAKLPLPLSPVDNVAS